MTNADGSSETLLYMMPSFVEQTLCIAVYTPFEIVHPVIEPNKHYHNS